MRVKKAVALVLAATLSLAGCLDRKEELRVHADGSVSVKQTLKGDLAEFDASAAEKLPAGAPWKVHDEDKAGDDGKKERTRTAEADFAKVEDIPESSGSKDDPAPLHCKTTLAITKTPEGRTRWTFERHYPARDHAWSQRIFDRAFTDELKKKLEHKEGDPPLPKETLEEACAALLQVEREKALTFLEWALARAPAERQSVAATLQARGAFAAAFDAKWKPADVLANADRSPEDRAAYEKKFRSWVGGELFTSAMFALGYTGWTDLPGELVPMNDALNNGPRTLEATDALQNHSFEVRVTLPGKVLLSDATSIEDSGTTAVFKFSGKDMNDEAHVLRAIAEGP